MDKGKHRNFCSICEFLGHFCQWVSLIPAGCNSCMLVRQKKRANCRLLAVKTVKW